MMDVKSLFVGFVAGTAIGVGAYGLALKVAAGHMTAQMLSPVRLLDDMPPLPKFSPDTSTAIAGNGWSISATSLLVCKLPEGMTTMPTMCTDDSPWVCRHSDGSRGRMCGGH